MSSDLLRPSREGPARLVTVAAGALLTVLIVHVLMVAQGIIRPFVIAVPAAYLLSALAETIGRIQIGGQVLPLWLRFGIGIVALAFLGWLAVRLIAGNVSQVIASAPGYEENLLRAMNRIGNRLGMEDLPRIQVVFEAVNVAGLVRRVALGHPREPPSPAAA